MADKDIVSREKIFEYVVKEAGEFYKLMVTVMIAFLGGTLLFVEKVCALQVGWSLWVLFGGWASLLISIGCIMWVRMKNVKSGDLALQEEYEKSSELDHKKECITKVSFGCFILGISLIMLFGGINFYLKRGADMTTSNKQYREDSIPFSSANKQQPQNNASDLNKSIPFGSVVKPDVPQPPPTGPNEKSKPPSEK